MGETNSVKKVLSVFGTRPEAIKMAPLVKALSRASDLSSVTLSTGQHAGMLTQAMEVFEITPDYQLNSLEPGQTLSTLGAKLLTGVEGILNKVKPDIVLVHGDTSSAMFAALAAFNLRIPVGHVEAGLRTNNLSEPFPEEWNRVAIAKLASIHFAPTTFAQTNLIRDGVSQASIKVAGNTIVDSVRLVFEKYLSNESWTVNSTEAIQNSVFRDFRRKPYALVTLHRRENAGSIFENYLSVIRTSAIKNPEFHFVFPVHPNPMISSLAQKLLQGIDNIHLVQPLDYLTFSHLLSQSSFVISDSGGIQEEAVTFGKPLLLCRGTTERPEAVHQGMAELIGSNFQLFESRMLNLISDGRSLKTAVADINLNLSDNPFGDGYASEKIADSI